jgi:CDP-diacylglycerol--glycerol-3-phosphate 3-phosphatidyltransferase
MVRAQVDAATCQGVPKGGASAAPEAAAVAPGRVSPLNLANALTFGRLALVPALGALLLAGGGHATGWRLGALAVFVLAALTDRVDGAVARRHGVVTTIGTVADPLADKALIAVALCGLSVIGDLGWWVTVVVLVREAGVTALRFWVIRHAVMPASRGGKWKTTVQGIAIGLYLLPLSGWPDTLRFWVMMVAVALTVLTGADYVARALALRRSSARAAGQRARRAAPHPPLRP